MKLNLKTLFLGISIISFCITSIYSIKKENISKVILKDNESTETRTKSIKIGNTKYTLNKDTFRGLLQNVFMEFTIKEKFETSKNCIDQIFDKTPDSSSISVIWNELTTKTYNNNTPVDKNWLLTFADSLKPYQLENSDPSSKESKLNCDSIVKNNLLSNDQINALGVINMSKNVRRLIENYINESRKEAEGRMKTFITSSASTYRNDPMVDKELFVKLNNKGKIPQKDTTTKK